MDVDIVLLGIIYDNKYNIIGFRVLEVNEDENYPVKDIPYNAMLKAYQNNLIQVRGLKLSHGKLVSSIQGNGFNNYGAILNNSIIRNALVVLTECPSKNYRVADTLGRVQIIPMANLFTTGFQVANMKMLGSTIVTLEGSQIPKDKLFDKYDTTRLMGFQALLGIKQYENENGCVSACEQTSYVDSLRFDLGVTSIKRNGFARYKNIVEVYTPESLLTIGERAFYQCWSLKDVYLNEGLEKIGNFAFEGTAIEVLEIPSTVTHLGAYICNNCNNLKVIRFHRASRRIIKPESLCNRRVKLEMID